MLLKHQAHLSALRVKGSRYGLDFFYAHKQEAVKLVDFLVAAIPCHSKASQELISHDTHSNTYNYKHTFSVEIVPICKVCYVCLSVCVFVCLCLSVNLCSDTPIKQFANYPINRYFNSSNSRYQ